MSRLLVFIYRVLVLSPRFLIVTRFTKRLIVVLIPHQGRVATVWDNVIDYCCLNVSSFCHTLHAQRMLAEVSRTNLSPLAVVSTLGRGRTFILWCVFIAVELSRIHKLWTAGVSAGALTLPRHPRTPTRVHQGNELQGHESS